jgi:hypothetical protein
MPANEESNRGPLRQAQDRHAPLATSHLFVLSLADQNSGTHNCLANRQAWLAFLRMCS